MSEEQLNDNLTDADWVSPAVEAGEGSAAFDVVRKLAALAAMLANKALLSKTAAGEADRALFGQAQAYQVGQGTLSAEEAADKVADRRASGWIATARDLLAAHVQKGFEVAGAAIAGYFHQDPEVGRQIGRAIGHFLNKDVKILIEKGLRAIESGAKRLWNWAKENAGTLLSKTKDWLFS